MLSFLSSTEAKLNGQFVESLLDFIVCGFFWGGGGWLLFLIY